MAHYVWQKDVHVIEKIQVELNVAMKNRLAKEQKLQNVLLARKVITADFCFLNYSSQTCEKRTNSPTKKTQGKGPAFRST